MLIVVWPGGVHIYGHTVPCVTVTHSLSCFLPALIIGNCTRTTVTLVR